MQQSQPVLALLVCSSVGQVFSTAASPMSSRVAFSCDRGYLMDKPLAFGLGNIRWQPSRKHRLNLHPLAGYTSH